MSENYSSKGKIIKIKIIDDSSKTLEEDTILTASIMKSENVTLEKILKLLVKIDKRLDNVEKRLDNVEKRLDNVEKRLDNLEARIDNLVKKNNLRE